MKAIIRIRGRVGLDKEINDTFKRMRLGKKFTCVVINPNKEQEGMIKTLKNFVSYGEIDKETFKKLVETRGQLIDKTKKVDFAKASEGIEKGKKYEDFNLKPYFRLHPARKGMNTKLHYPKGVLGENKEIIKLIERML